MRWLVETNGRVELFDGKLVFFFIGLIFFFFGIVASLLKIYTFQQYHYTVSKNILLRFRMT